MAEPIENLKTQFDELQRKHKRTAHELSSMINAQGNLYRFQERIEQQKIIYAQIAHVGQQFNESLSFDGILQSIDRFILDLLNYERYVLFLPDPNAPVKLVQKSRGGYRTPELEEKIKPVALQATQVQLKPLIDGQSKIVCLETERDALMEDLRTAFSMNEFLIYSLGKTESSLKGVLVVGNSKENAALHQRASNDEEIDALFGNITAQLAGAINTTKFLEAIQHESEQVKRLLNNMRQAVFSVTQAGAIVEPVSKFADDIFGLSIVGQKVFDSIFKDMPRNSEAYTSLTTAFSTVFGEGELQWDLMEDQFQKRILYMKPGAEKDPERVLKVNYRPIWDASEILEKIMFVVEDITELEKLERQIAKERTEIQIIQELARNTIESNTDFFTRTIDLMTECKSNVRSLTKDAVAMGPLMRNLHTLKGNARLLGFGFISKRVHIAESIVLEIKGKLAENNIIESQQKTFQELFEIQEQIQDYAKIAHRILNIKSKFEPPIFEELAKVETEFLKLKPTDPQWKILGTQFVWIAKSLRDEKLTGACDKLLKTLTEAADTAKEIQEAQTAIKNLKEGKSGDSKEVAKTLEIAESNLQKLEKTITALTKASDQSAIQIVQREFKRLFDLPVKPMLLKFQTMVREVSNTLGKKLQYEVTGTDVTLSKEKMGSLQDALVHLIRNGIDHGIESPEDRKKAGKGEVGQIKVECSEKGDETILKVLDDGKGIDPKKISEIALKKKIITDAEFKSMTDDQRLKLIFKPGFSSKEQATELSGRGVGMEIVETLVKKINGTLTVISQIGQGSEFKITIKN